MKLSDIAKLLDEAYRFGAEKDDPEGARHIVLSDTVAKDIARILREHTCAS